MHIQKHCKTYLPHFQFQFNSVTLEIVQILSLNFALIPMHAEQQNQLLEPKNLLLRSFNFTYNSKKLKKPTLL